MWNEALLLGNGLVWCESCQVAPISSTFYSWLITCMRRPPSRIVVTQILFMVLYLVRPGTAHVLSPVDPLVPTAAALRKAARSDTTSLGTRETESATRSRPSS